MDEDENYLIELDVDARVFEVCYQMHVTDWYRYDGASPPLGLAS